MRRYLGVAFLGFVLAACGGPSDGPAEKPTSGRSDLQLRVVVLTSADADPATGQKAPPAEWADRFEAFSCDAATPTGTPAKPDDYGLACDSQKEKFLLAPAAWSGKVKSAAAGIPQGQAVWAVNIALPRDGRTAVEELSRDLMASGGQAALVLRGAVISHGGFDGVISTGELQITGGFTEKNATLLAQRLKGS